MFSAAYNPFLTGEGVANVFSDPVFVRKYCDGKVSLIDDCCATFSGFTYADRSHILFDQCRIRAAQM